MRDYAATRHNMVEGQLRTNEVTEPRLIEAIEAVPRERFVPEHLRAMEPRLARFQEIRRKWDPECRLRSAMSVRLLGDPI